MLPSLRKTEGWRKANEESELVVSQVDQAGSKWCNFKAGAVIFNPFVAGLCEGIVSVTLPTLGIVVTAIDESGADNQGTQGHVPNIVAGVLVLLSINDALARENSNLQIGRY